MSDILLIHLGPADGERTTYEFSVSKLMNVEAIAIEKATGLTLSGLIAGMYGKSAIAVTAAVWVLRKRREPRLLFSDVEFSIGDCEIEDPDEEPDPAPEEQAAPKEPANKAPKKRAAR